MATFTAPPTHSEVMRRRTTYEEYLRQASETRIAEWVDGEMIEYMPPNAIHQKITWFLFRLLSAFAEALDLGLVGAGPLEVKLWPDGPSREPDVFFIAEQQLPLLSEERFTGAPALVIEIVSPGSVREDRVRKFTEYEQAGVQEYWLVDPRPNQRTVEYYRRDENGIFQPVEASADGRLYSTVLAYEGAPFWLKISWLWQEPLPKAATCLREIFDSDERFAR